LINLSQARGNRFDVNFSMAATPRCHVTALPWHGAEASKMVRLCGFDCFGVFPAKDRAVETFSGAVE
jgi:hypothetical protein